MWNYTVELCSHAVISAFGWFQQILDAAPGAWNAIFTMFAIFVVSRFLLGPVLGASFSGQSDRATIKAMKHQNKLREASKK